MQTSGGHSETPSQPRQKYRHPSWVLRRFFYGRNAPRAFWLSMTGTALVVRGLGAVTLIVAAVLLISLCACPDRVFGAPLVVKMAVGLCPLGTQFVMRTVYRSGKWRFLQRIRKAEYRVCLNCEYALQGLPETYECPECGTGYTKEGLRAAWHDWEFDGV
jgi:hypothetical protein